MKPIYIHSGMAGAPQYANANDNINGILTACLTDEGFNSRTATSASASGGVLTLNFASDPGFEALQTVEVAVSSVALVNGQHRVVANTNNQVTIAIAGLPDGAVGSSGAGITVKQAGAGWSKPFSKSTVSVFRPPAGARRYLRCVHAAGGNFETRGYESMSDADTGVNPFPTVAQAATPRAVRNADFGIVAGTPWIFMAFGNWFSFAFANSATPNYSVGTLHFGQLLESGTLNPDYNSMICIFGGSYIERSYTGDAGAVGCTIAPQSSGAAWPSVILGGGILLPYVPVKETTGEIYRGIIPNAYALHPNPPANQILSLLENVQGVSGRVKPMNANQQASMNFAYSIDDEVWT